MGSYNLKTPYKNTVAVYSLDKHKHEGKNHPDSLIEMLAHFLATPLTLYQKSMEAKLEPFKEGWKREFILRGRCPHCEDNCAFIKVTEAYSEHIGSGKWKVCAVLQCPICQDYILGILSLTRHRPNEFNEGPEETIDKVEHFPFGRPKNQYAPDVVPSDVANDFLEARKSYSAEAYNAAVVMCGTAVEASCREFKAKGRTLVEKIDDLAKQGLITTSLKDMAHKIRLSRNRGAHRGDQKVLINEKYASAVIEFTRLYIEHLYVMPNSAKKFNVDGQLSL